MAKQVGLSHSSIGRIWRTFGLKPHRTKSFRLSEDPFLIEKVRDIVGLYMSPPDNAVVLSLDEKSQIQALARATPVLPMDVGMPERRTHNYVRHGTTDLFAALDVATGQVLGRCFNRHRGLEFLKFLKDIDAYVAPSLDVHVILDNLSTHKTPVVMRWLVRHPRFHLHFTPTHALWLNMVERFFGMLTQQALQRASHTSVPSCARPSRPSLTLITNRLSHFAGRRRPMKSSTRCADSLLAPSPLMPHELLQLFSDPGY